MKETCLKYETDMKESSKRVIAFISTGSVQCTCLIKTVINRQPTSDMVAADRTTTTTLPAMLTRAPSPAPTMI